MSAPTPEQRIIADLYEWIINEFDSSPAPIADYVTAEYIGQAQAALFACGVAEAESDDEDEDEDDQDGNGAAIELSSQLNGTTLIRCHGCGWSTVHPGGIADAFDASISHNCPDAVEAQS